MRTKIFKLAAVVFVFGILLSAQVFAARASGEVLIDESGIVKMDPGYSEWASASSLQISLTVKPQEADAAVSFQFDDTNAKIAEYRYHADTGVLNLYLAGTEGLFDGNSPLTLGKVVVLDGEGNAAAATVGAVEGSLKYVYGTALQTADQAEMPADVRINVPSIPEFRYTGLLCENGVWVYYENGERNTAKTGLVPYDGAWFFVRNGIMDTATTGFVDYDTGTFYVAEGRVVREYSGLAADGADWYFIAEGQVQKQYSGLALYDGAWFLLENGKLNNSYNGLYSYDGAEFLVADGQILFSYSGLFLYGGKWYFIAGGQVNKYTGLTAYDNAWFYIESGILAEGYTGWVWYDGSQFYVINGMVQP